MNLIRKAACALTLLTASVSGALAADTTWVFNNGVSKIGNGYGNTLAKEVDGEKVTITAWSDSNFSLNTSAHHVESANVDYNTHGLLSYGQRHEQINNWNDGWSEVLGVDYGRSDSSHTIDNRENTEMLLFSFEEAVALTGINLGWTENDSDISIVAFDTLPSLGGQTWSQVASAATFATSFANVATGWSSLTSIAHEAKYWLIGAYSSVFGDRKWTEGNDGFKLLALTTHRQDTPPSEVPAPATGALMAVLFAVVMYRRRAR